MRVALGTVELTDHQARAIRLATEQPGELLPNLPRPATREQCRTFLTLYGRNGVARAEADLVYLEGRHAARKGWRRGQPEVRR